MTLTRDWTEDREANPSSLLDHLYRRHSLAALRLAYLLTGSRPTAEDLVHDAFLRVVDHLGGLRERSAFAAYLRSTVVNLAKARIRRQRIERLYLRQEMAHAAERSRYLPPEFDRDDAIWEALQRLPYRQRAALALRYLEDLPEKQTAEVLGTSLASIKALVSRGIRSVRRELEERGWEE